MVDNKKAPLKDSNKLTLLLIDGLNAMAIKNPIRTAKMGNSIAVKGYLFCKVEWVKLMYFCGI